MLSPSPFFIAGLGISILFGKTEKKQEKSVSISIFMLKSKANCIIMIKSYHGVAIERIKTYPQMGK